MIQVCCSKILPKFGLEVWIFNYYLLWLFFQERSSYLEYQKVMREIEHLSRLYIAYQFLLAEDTKERSAEELKEMQDKILKLQEVLSENEKKIKALNCEIEELEKRKDKVRTN